MLNSFINWINIYTRDYIPAAILFNFILFIFLLVRNYHFIKSFLQEIKTSTWIILFLIVVVALLTRLFIPPHQHIMYIDEPWYMEAGKNILQSGNHVYYPKSVGWPFLLAIFFGFFGISNWVALYAAMILGSLTVITIFFLSLAMTKSQAAGLASALIFSLFAYHIRWSASAETNAPSLFFITLVLFFCFLYYKYQKNTLLWLSLIGLAFVAQFRPENYFFPILFLLGCFLFIEDFYKKINIEFVAPVIVMIILALPNFVQVYSFQSATNWIESDSKGSMTGENFSLTNLVNNSKESGAALFTTEFQPILFVILFFSGIFYAVVKRRKEAIYLLFWLCSMYFMYFSAWFQTLGGRERFYLSFFPITVIFMSYGLLFISHDILGKIKIIWFKHAIFFILAMSTAILFLPFTLKAGMMYSDTAHKLETKIPELAEKDIPANCVIIATWPTVLKSTTKLNVVNIDDFLDQTNKDNTILRDNDCVLFFDDIFCLDFGYRIHGHERGQCSRIKKEYKLEEYKNYSEKYKTYFFYRILKDNNN